MERQAGAVLAELVRELEEEGPLLERRGDSDDYDVRSTGGEFALQPVLTMPESLLVEYVEQLAEDPDLPLDALSLASVHVVEELTTDHHEGRNYVRALGFRRGRRGRVELFVEKDVPPIPHRPPDPDLQWTAYRPDEW